MDAPNVFLYFSISLALITVEDFSASFYWQSRVVETIYNFVDDVCRLLETVETLDTMANV